MEPMRVNLKRTCDDSYDIFIGQGDLAYLESIRRVQGDADRYVIITDSMVNPLYGDMVRKTLQEGEVPVDIIEITAGEASKSMSTVLDVAGRLMALNASRKSLLIALGGGVVGDLTGFVASIFKRSIPFVQIATSLVAQVDSSVGGKTGVDIREGKNLLGTFYQPKAVFIDLLFLRTLPDKELRNGLAEVIKYGIIRDPEMFGMLEREKDAVFDREPVLLNELISRSCRIKADIVEADELEGGLRRILNFGHTMGHALEAASDYGLSHGEAVAIGTVAATRISQKLGHLDEAVGDRITALVKQYGLPAHISPDFDAKEILDFMARDKKAVGTQVNFVLTKGLGKPFVTSEVPKVVITEVIEELRP